MISTLHLPTIALCCAVNAALFALVLANLRNPWVKVPGTPFFALSALCSAVAYGLVAFEPSGDTPWVQFGRVTASIAVYGLIACGLCAFHGRRVPWIELGLSLVAGAAVALAYPNDAGNVMPRVLVASGLCAAWSLLGAALLLRRIPGLPRMGPLCVGVGLVGMTAIYLLRAARLAADGVVTGTEAAAPTANLALLLVGQVALVMVLGGLAMLWNARVVLEISRLANQDPLTGALTRRGFNASWPSWRAHHGPGWALLMDLDGFKQLNDQLGHAAGDEALQRFAALARSILPTDSLLARQGGDEFLALVPQSLPEAEVRALCERLVAGFGAALSQRWPAHARQAGVSIGYATMGEQLAESVRRADAALYRAKQRGRSQAAGVDSSALPLSITRR